LTNRDELIRKKVSASLNGEDMGGTL